MSPSPPASASPTARRWAGLRLALALVLLGLSLPHGDPVPVLVLPAASDRAPADADPRLEPIFQAQLTADDVARGVWALSRGEGPGLSAEQRAALLPLSLRGRDARVEVDRLRASRRAHRAALRDSGLALLLAAQDRGWQP